MLGRDLQLDHPDRTKPSMPWQYTSPSALVEGVPSSNPPPPPFQHQQTYVTMPDTPILQGYYTTTSAPVEGTATFVDPIAKLRPTYFPQPSTSEVPVFITTTSRVPMQSHSSREDDRLSNLSEEAPSRVKLLCSYGGRILPRPSDGRLRYVGGDTRMVTVNRDTGFNTLMSKMVELQQMTVAIKYQLPDEDLDALVSVSSEEDLENMMEEYDKMEAGDAHPRLRVFLFTSLDYDAPVVLGDGSGDVKNPEQQYLEAVNGISSETLSRKQSDSSVQSAANSSPQSNNTYVHEAAAAPAPAPAPAAVLGIPQATQGVPLVAQYVPGMADGTVLPAAGIHYGYVDGGQTGEYAQDSPLLKGDMVLEDFLQQSVVQMQQQQVPQVVQVPQASPILQTPQVLPQVVQVQDMQRAFLVPHFQGFVDPSPSQPHVQTTEEYAHPAVPQVSNWSTYAGGTPVNMSQWSSSSAVYSDPSGSTGFHTFLPQNATYNGKVQFVPEQVQYEPISTYEYQAVGEKLNLQKPRDFQNAVVHQNLNWNPKQTEQIAQVESTAYTAADSSAYGGTLSGWSVPSVSRQIASSSNLEPETSAATLGLQLPDSLVNFLEDSVSAVRTERAHGYPHGSGSDSSTTTQMMHSGNSSTNMVFDLLTSDEVYCCKTSCASSASGGSVAASSTSTSSSHVLQVYSDPSPTTKVLHENQNEAPLISLAEGDPFHLPPAAAAGEDNVIMKEMAALSLYGMESFAFAQAEKSQDDAVSSAAPADGERDKCDRSLDTSDLEITTAAVTAGETTVEITAVTTEVTTTDLAALIDLSDPELEGASISAEESEAIARARGLQVIKHDDLEEIRELGSGTFGTVYHGKWRGTDVAIKRIKSSCFFGPPSEQSRLKDDFWSEACILAHLHHPNVVAFYGVVPDSPGGTLATVTEFMVNGSLKQVLHKKDRLMDRRRRLLVAMDAAFGMEYLHNKKIIHFDLKGENLLVNMRDPQRPICKVGDLGLSKIKQKTMVTGGVRGTLPWMAPELLNGKSSSVSEKVDVFSFGIVMWELLTGEEPYAELHYGAIIGGIVSNNLRPPIPSSCEPEWKSLMERCWADDPEGRPTFSEIVRELRGLMVYYAKQAPGAQGVGVQQQQQAAPGGEIK